MKSQKNKLANQVLDTVLGYTVVILTLACFMVGLAAVAAIVRLIAGGVS